MKKTARKSINGVWTALITPFDSLGNVDYDSFAKLVDMQLKGGVSGLVVAGTTGEAPTLANEEKLKLVEHCRRLVGNEIGVMAGTGGNNTAESIALSKAAAEAGADSVLVVTPPYNKPSMAGLKLHFSMICAAIDVPVCLYHVPGRTAQKLTGSQIAELCEIPGIAAVKEASGDLSLFADCERLTPTPLLSGDDPTYLGSLAIGGKGCISVLSNVYPRELVQLTEAAMAGDYERARHLNRALMPFIHALFIESNPGPTKYVLHKRGIGANMLRAPLVPVSSTSAASIEAAWRACDKDLGL